MTSQTPLEAAKILVFSQNQYDFWNQHPKNIEKRCGPVSDGKKRYIGPPPTRYLKLPQCTGNKL